MTSLVHPRAVASEAKPAQKRIVLMHPYIPPGASEAVAETLKSRYIGQGPRVDEFEWRFSEKILGGAPCVAVGSCTDALHLAYLLAGIGPGSEVLVPLFTCTATTIPLLYLGANIRFVDVAPNSLNVDPWALKKMVTERTKAIVIVHYGGAMVDISGLYPETPVIEDCAQALGAPMDQPSSFKCFSFQAVKHITTGDGGMLVLPPNLVEKAKRMRWFGIDRAAKLAGIWSNDITEIGYKYQMTDVGASLGLAGLALLEEQLWRRRFLLNHYAASLRDVPGIQMLNHDPQGAAWLCTVAVENREGLKRKLLENEIESDQVHYRNDRYTIFEKFRRPGEFPNMDAIESKYLCLPLHMHMNIHDVHRVCEVIRSGW